MRWTTLAVVSGAALTAGVLVPVAATATEQGRSAPAAEARADHAAATAATVKKKPCPKGKKKKVPARCKPKPDLKVQSVKGVPKKAAPGAKAAVKVKVKNVGGAKAKASRVTLFLAAGTTKTAAATKLTGNASIPKLKKKKAATVKVDTRLVGKAGAWHVIACVKTVKKEAKTANNCGASAKVQLGSKTSTEPFPEWYVGTFTVEYDWTMANVNEGKNQTGTFHTNTKVSGDLTLTRFSGNTYLSSGKFDWEVANDEHYTEGARSVECVGEGEGKDVPIVAFTGENFGKNWASLNLPAGGNLAPGSTYSTWGSSDNFQIKTSCTDNDSSWEQPVSGTVTSLLPRPLDTCALKSSPYAVRPDGRLAGSDRCDSITYQSAPGGNQNTYTVKITWTWDLVPES